MAGINGTGASTGTPVNGGNAQAQANSDAQIFEQITEVLAETIAWEGYSDSIEQDAKYEARVEEERAEDGE